ncbi:MAG: hypothetical protein ACSLEZ_15105 [Thiobacillus sp.]
MMAKRNNSEVKAKTRQVARASANARPSMSATQAAILESSTIDRTLVWWPKVTLHQYSLKTMAFTGKTLPLEPVLTDQIVQQASSAATSISVAPTSRVASQGKPATHKRRVTAPATTRK